MSSIPSLNSNEIQKLDGFHKDFGKITRHIGCALVPASFLFVGALIVITNSCLCLTLPGINVMTDVVIKGILPASGGILLSIPLIVYGIISRREQNEIRTNHATTLLGYINTYDVINLSKDTKPNEQIRFVLVNFLKWGFQENPKKWIRNIDYWTKEYQGKLIAEIKDKLDKSYPKEGQGRTEKQKNFLTSLDEARGKIYAKDKDLNKEFSN